MTPSDPTSRGGAEADVVRVPSEEKLRAILSREEWHDGTVPLSDEEIANMRAAFFALDRPQDYDTPTEYRFASMGRMLVREVERLWPLLASVCEELAAQTVRIPEGDTRRLLFAALEGRDVAIDRAKKSEAAVERMTKALRAIRQWDSLNPPSTLTDGRWLLDVVTTGLDSP